MPCGPTPARSPRRPGSPHLLEGSEIIASHSDDFHHAVQDAYSLRCAPQVHGAVSDTLDHLDRVLTVEMGSVVDNPIVFPETGEVLSGGNFHGEPLAFGFDFAAIAVSELASISERRTDRILDPVRSSGLTPFLATKPGVESGYMITQYVQAALVAENRVLSHPASVDSVPTSGGQEDHVSMGWGGARKLMTIVDNVRRVLAIEIICAVTGMEQRSPLRPAPGTAAVAGRIRELVPPLQSDRSPSAEIELVADLIESGTLTDAGLMASVFLTGVGRLVTNVGEPMVDAVVAVEDGRITYAGPATDAPDQTGERIDCEGRAVIPGFVDAHTHLVFAGDRSARVRRTARRPLLLRDRRGGGWDHRHRGTPPVLRGQTSSSASPPPACGE